MKSFITILLVISISGTMIFGAFLMLHGGIDGHNICPLGLIDLRDCAPGVNPIEYVSMHLGALNWFVAPTVPTISLLLFAIVLIVFASRTVDFGYESKDILFAVSPARISIPPRIQQKLLRWFAMHEKRDPLKYFSR